MGFETTESFVLFFGGKMNQKKLMAKSYNISRVILAVMTFLIFRFMFIHEDESWNTVSFIFGIIVFFISFPSTLISRLIIKLGDKLGYKPLKFLYYFIALPITVFILFLGIYYAIFFIADSIPTPNEFGAALSQALWTLFFMAVGTICVVVPYIQTLIVLILKRFLKE